MNKMTPFNPDQAFGHVVLLVLRQDRLELVIAGIIVLGSLFIRENRRLNRRRRYPRI
jgi:hypothetical protein